MTGTRFLRLMLPVQGCSCVPLPCLIRLRHLVNDKTLSVVRLQAENSYSIHHDGQHNGLGWCFSVSAIQCPHWDLDQLVPWQHHGGNFDHEPSVWKPAHRLHGILCWDRGLFLLEHRLHGFPQNLLNAVLAGRTASPTTSRYVFSVFYCPYHRLRPSRCRLRSSSIEYPAEFWKCSTSSSAQFALCGIRSMGHCSARVGLEPQGKDPTCPHAAHHYLCRLLHVRVHGCGRLLVVDILRHWRRGASRRH